MKVIVIGANGFVGRNVARELRGDDSLKVIAAGRGDTVDIVIDLLDKESISRALTSIKPDVIVNCAGVVANDETAYQNGVFCKNIFETVVAINQPYPKIIITGSAAEYGIVGNHNPVDEDMPLRATNDYGKSKIEEEAIARDFAEKFGIDVIVARIFNPIGPGMGDKFLLTSLERQIKDFQRGLTHEISLSRLDTRRDYVDIRDVARAIHSFAVSENKSHQIAQNIGSGYSTTNGELLQLLINHIELKSEPTIIETRDAPEPIYAACADISRIKNEYGWQPSYELNKTMGDIFDE